MQPLSTSNSDSGHEITPILHTESTAVHSPHLGSRSACVPPARPFQDAWILLQLHLPFADSKQRHGEPAQLHPLRSGPSFRLIHHRLIRQLQLPRRRLAATHRNAIKTIPLRFIRTDHNIPATHCRVPRQPHQRRLAAQYSHRAQPAFICTTRPEAAIPRPSGDKPRNNQHTRLAL